MTSPVVELEDRIGAQLLLAQIGLGPAPSLEPRYEVLELRGRGARGVVCRGRDRTLGREVALKLYSPQADEQLPREVAREAQALARLDHPNVVRVYDVGAAALVTGADRAACIYLSMEFIEGKNLRAWRTEARRSRRELMRVLLSAGEGLAAAHEVGLVHRDVKPENIMLDATGRVRLVDFGLARGGGVERPWMWNDGSPAEASLAARLTRVGTTPGTLEYMSPESRLGEANAASDQYSFAATAWETLTGELPFDVHRVARGDATAVAPKGGAVLSTRLRRVLERALDPRPERRWPSVRVLLRKLRRATAIRWSVALMGLGLVGGLGAAVWRELPSEPATAASITSQAAAGSGGEASETDRAACQRVAGRWSLGTVVTWAHDSVRWHGVNGYYQLELEPLADCAARLRLRKTGDSGNRSYAPQYVREAEAAVTLQPTPQGVRVSTDVDLSSTQRARNRYHLELLFDGDRLRGDWRWVPSRTEPMRWKGWLAGERNGRAEQLLPGPSGQPCESQCRVLCSSALAVQACVESECADPTAQVEGGCAPMRDFAPPSIARDLLLASVLDLRLAIPSEEDLALCRQATEALAGSWQLWLRRDDDVRPLALELSPALGECTLRAEVREADGAVMTLDAIVDGRGAWVLVSRGRSPSVVMSLMGWNPAYGVAADGAALSAHRQDVEL